jgi:hypothetical protein
MRLIQLLIPVALLLVAGCVEPAPLPEVYRGLPSDTRPIIPRLVNEVSTLVEKMDELSVTSLQDPNLTLLTNKGNANIIGQAFLKTRGGDVKYAAGCKVTLFPKVAYIDATLRCIVANRALESFQPYSAGETTFVKNVKRPNANTVASFSKYGQYTTVDGSGNFLFAQLPAGEYILYCIHEWSVGRYQSGGMLYITVRIGDGESQRVILNETIESKAMQ